MAADRFKQPTDGGITTATAVIIGTVVVLVGALSAGLILHSSSGQSASRQVKSAYQAGDVRPGPPSRFHERLPQEVLPPPKRIRERSPTLLKPGAAASFDSLAGSISGRIGLAISPLSEGSIETFGPLQEGHAWSSIKVPILVTLMDEEKLSPEEQGWASQALTASDNAAAADLFGQLERIRGGLLKASGAVQQVLAESGDTGTTVATAPPPPGAVSTYGQTEWALEGSVQFYRALARGCLLPRARTDYVLGLMGEVIPEQRWGLGEASFPADWTVAIKGGWGPEAASGGGYLVRQSGVVTEGGDSGFAVTMAAEDDAGTYEAGAQDLTQIAGWLSGQVDAPLPAIEACS